MTTAFKPGDVVTLKCDCTPDCFWNRQDAVVIHTSGHSHARVRALTGQVTGQADSFALRKLTLKSSVADDDDQVPLC